jgi:hypothetical protein
MWFCRFFLFKFYESPKNLLARGHKDRAVDSLNGIAIFNNSDARISVEELCHDTGGVGGVIAGEEARKRSTERKMWIWTLKEHLAEFGPSRLKPLFATKKMGWTTVIVWFLWIDIQIGNIPLNLPTFSVHHV